MSAVLAGIERPSAWRAALPAVALALAAVVGLYLDAFAGMAAIWSRSDTFAHAWLVPPIVAWLVWRRRAELAAQVPRPAPAALVLTAAAALAWLLGELAAVNAVVHVAAVALLVSVVPAVLGWAVARRLAFALAFAFFMVPIGEFMLDPMMEGTADFTVWALQASGVPVYREGRQFVIPSGTWSVVEACSGVRYLIASFMVGSLFAYVNYRAAWRRWVFVALSLLVPIVANWVRAYLIVMLGHLSNNRIAVGVDHLVYGWVFFGIVIGLMYIVGARWAEPDAAPASAEGSAATAAATGGDARPWLGAALAVAVLAPAPALAWWLHAPAEAAPPALTLPVLAGTAAARDKAPPLRPRFDGAAAEVQRVYAVDGVDVAVHVAYFGAPRPGAKSTSSTHSLASASGQRWRTVDDAPLAVDVPGVADGRVTLRRRMLAVNLGIGGPTRPPVAVAQVYWSGRRLTASRAVTVIDGVVGRLSGGNGDSAVLTLLTEGEPAAADARLAAFAAQHLPAIVAAIESTRSAAR